MVLPSQQVPSVAHQGKARARKRDGGPGGGRGGKRKKRNEGVLGLKPKKGKFDTLLDLCVSSLRRGHANLLCIVPILTDDPRRESDNVSVTAGRLHSMPL